MSRIFRLLPLVFISILASSGLGTISAQFVLDTHAYSKRFGDTLKLDLRMPLTPLTDCPGVVFVHGGGFQIGKRDSEPVSAFLDALAAAGVASASISYRLTMAGRGFGCDVRSEEKRAAVAHAAEDLIDALDWLQQHPSTRDWSGGWIAAGSSAGAEAVLWSAYVDSPSRWEGAISFSGALDAGSTANSSLPPLLAIHGTCDKLVPVESDLHHFCPEDSPGAWLLIGGPAWADSLRQEGQFAWRWRFCGAGHGICTTALRDREVQKLVLDWLTLGRGTNRDILTDPLGLPLSQSRSSCPQPCN